MHIIKNGRIVADDTRHLSDDEPLPTTGRCTISAARWQREKDALCKTACELGIRLTGDDELEALVGDLPRFALIVIEFPTMTDGRGFSLARLLRERYGYRGELRARGDYVRDQMFFMHRVGIDAFEYKDEQALASLLPALNEFTVRYQAAVDEPLPLYRRR